MAAVPLVFILWGSDFDEPVAGMIKKVFENSGLDVRVVALDDGEPPASLRPDLYWNDALDVGMRIVSAVVLPCTSERFLRLALNAEPHWLFLPTSTNRYPLLIGAPGVAALKLHRRLDTLRPYPCYNELERWAETMAYELIDQSSVQNTAVVGGSHYRRSANAYKSQPLERFGEGNGHFCHRCGCSSPEDKPPRGYGPQPTPWEECGSTDLPAGAAPIAATG